MGSGIDPLVHASRISSRNFILGGSSRIARLQGHDKGEGAGRGCASCHAECEAQGLEYVSPKYVHLFTNACAS
jgi:hypothetical protein